VEDGWLFAVISPKGRSVALKEVEVRVYTGVEAYRAGTGAVLTEAGVDVGGADAVIIEVRGKADFKRTDDGIEIVTYAGEVLDHMLALVNPAEDAGQ